jgi:hypothetical protein
VNSSAVHSSADSHFRPFFLSVVISRYSFTVIVSFPPDQAVEYFILPSAQSPFFSIFEGGAGAPDMSKYENIYNGTTRRKYPGET